MSAFASGNLYYLVTGVWVLVLARYGHLAMASRNISLYIEYGLMN